MVLTAMFKEFTASEVAKDRNWIPLVLNFLMFSIPNAPEEDKSKRNMG